MLQHERELQHTLLRFPQSKGNQGSGGEKQKHGSDDHSDLERDELP